MEIAIIAGTLMLGLAGAPHCTAMCGAPCAAVVGRGDVAASALAFHAARMGGYALAGGVAAGGLVGLSALSLAAPMLRPLWALVHAGIFMLGLWLLWQGRQPALLARIGRGAGPTVAVAGWQPVIGPQGQGARVGWPARAALAGGAWFAWPCGLLQSALMVAALSNTAAGGAMAMAVFAVASSSGLVLAPLLWRRLGRSGGERAERWALRGAGLLLALTSGWALTEGVWHRVAAYCATL